MSTIISTAPMNIPAAASLPQNIKGNATAKRIMMYDSDEEEDFESPFGDFSPPPSFHFKSSTTKAMDDSCSDCSESSTSNISSSESSTSNISSNSSNEFISSRPANYIRKKVSFSPTCSVFEVERWVQEAEREEQNSRNQKPRFGTGKLRQKLSKILNFQQK